MPVDDATAILSSRVRLVEHVEIVDLGHADGRILAGDICAPLPLPPFTNSAVDGYAVSSRDLSRDPTREFTIVGRIKAGAAAVEALTPGRAVRIFTGAAMLLAPTRYSCRRTSVSTPVATSSSRRV
jgi:molybdopterin molybdotransferase